MFGGGDGNLSDTSDAPSNISNISEALNGRGHLVSQNLNLSVTSNSSVGEDPKTQEIRRLREENSRLKRRLQDILGDSEEDDEDARKDWSELSKKRKKQLLSNIPCYEPEPLGPHWYNIESSPGQARAAGTTPV